MRDLLPDSRVSGYSLVKSWNIVTHKYALWGNISVTGQRLLKKESFPEHFDKHHFKSQIPINEKT